MFTKEQRDEILRLAAGAKPGESFGWDEKLSDLSDYLDSITVRQTFHRAIEQLMREYGKACERAAYERAAQWIEGVAATDDGRLLLSQSYTAANLRALGADK